MLNDEKRATGVRYSYLGIDRTVRARKEVVICAGGIGSPKLLMLSGIGPAEHLRQHDIPVVQNLPGVGENLQDHLATPTVTFTLNESVSLGPPAVNPETYKMWSESRKGNPNSYITHYA